jgi:asparagine synthetase A
MAFMTLSELKEMINKLTSYIKNAQTRIQKLYYEDAMKNLVKAIEIIESEENNNNVR